MKFELIVPGEPIPQGRPKFSTQGGFVRAIDPPKSRNQKQLIALMARQKMINGQMLQGKLKLTVKVYCHYPKSWSKKRIASDLNTGKETRPDTDNYIKLVQDSLNKVVYQDDSNIVEINASKYWSDKNETYICIEEI